MIQPLPSWNRALETILSDPGLTVLVGPCDSGKTTFLRFLLERAIAAFELIGVVDSDIGQSSIGPPTAIGLSFFPRGAGVAPPPWPSEAL